MYIKFCNFGSYGNVKVSGASKEESSADVLDKKVCLYKRISAVFIILALTLLAVAVALAMKLHEVQSIQKCQESADVEELNCSRDLCQTLYPPTKAVEKNRCSAYGKGWGMFENSCFFKSEERLNWQESREACQEQGGDLAVIDNERVQEIQYAVLDWTSLFRAGAVDVDQRYRTNPEVRNECLDGQYQHYWSPRQPNPDTQGSCALLNGETPQINNWFSNYCHVISHYICQMR